MVKTSLVDLRLMGAGSDYGGNISPSPSTVIRGKVEIGTTHSVTLHPRIQTGTMSKLYDVELVDAHIQGIDPCFANTLVFLQDTGY